MKWSFFAGAAIMVSYFLLNHGAPAAGVLPGIVIAGLLNWWNLRRAHRQL